MIDAEEPTKSFSYDDLTANLATDEIVGDPNETLLSEKKRTKKGMTLQVLQLSE